MPGSAKTLSLGLWEPHLKQGSTPSLLELLRAGTQPSSRWSSLLLTLLSVHHEESQVSLSGIDRRLPSATPGIEEEKGWEELCQLGLPARLSPGSPN